MKSIQIEIWSDMVCPFCLVGKKKLELAIQKLGAQDKVNIIWHSYQLDPDFPIGTSTPSTQNLLEKKGINIEQLTGMYEYLRKSGENYGIDFQFEQSLTFNTLNVHRLWHWTMQFNKENEWKEAVMRAYFTDGVDLSVKENLLQLVNQIGLDPLDAANVLASDMFLDEVRNDIYNAQNMGIRGVPFFLINNTHAISGAQEDTVFEETLSNALNN
jgi:predicted DsbA family dithiol-disulfide isomerase